MPYFCRFQFKKHLYEIPASMSHKTQLHTCTARWVLNQCFQDLPYREVKTPSGMIAPKADTMRMPCTCAQSNQLQV